MDRRKVDFMIERMRNVASAGTVVQPRRRMFAMAVLAICCGLALPNLARAALVVSVKSTDVVIGSTTFVDVVVRSTTGADLLDVFGLELRITPTAGSYLQFSDPPLNMELADSSYLFFSDSAAIQAGPPASLVLSLNGVNDVYIGGDGTFSGAGLFVPTTDTLLARVQIEADSDTPGGSQFAINIEESGTFFAGPVPESGDPEFIEFTSRSGTIAAVPEPASLLTLGGLIGLCAFTRVARRRMPRIE
jgi:hypothetical protein